MIALRTACWRRFEAELGECLSVLGELDFLLDHLKEWMSADDVPTPFIQKPGRSRIIKDPKGVVLVRLISLAYALNLIHIV